MRRTIRAGSRTLLITVFCLIAQNGASSPSSASSVFVARRGWHIDIGLKVEDLGSPVDSTAAHLPQPRYAFFGFADKHYLLAPKHSAPVLLAALWPGAGIILLTGLTNTPAEAFGEKQVIELQLNPAQLASLQTFIWKSLRTQGDSADVYQPGPYDDSAYFLAAPKYSAFHTCNTWGAEALKAAGFRVHSHGVLFAGQLWTQARRLQREQQP